VNKFTATAPQKKADRLAKALEFLHDSDFEAIEISTTALGFATAEEKELVAAQQFKNLLHSNLRYARLLQEEPAWLLLRSKSTIIAKLKKAALEVTDADLRYALLYRAHHLQFYS
jgi:hypothetical protein